MEALIQRARRGDVRAQAQLFEDWLPVVVRWCVRLSGPRLDPEDVAHDVFVRVLTRLETLRDPARFEAWLYQVTRWEIARHRRRAWIRKWTGGAVPDVADAAPDPRAHYLSSEVSRTVQAIVERLPAKQREVLVLCEIEGRTAPEVADLLDVPVGTVASRLRAARRAFQKHAVRASLSPDEAVPTGGS